MKLAVLVALVACSGHPDVIEPTARPLPPHSTVALDQTPKQQRRMVQPEVFLRSYLEWFGGLAPLEVQKRAKAGDLFDEWRFYTAALGLPDYKLDTPRTTESNTIMLATIGRLAEALCLQSVEHDLVAGPPIDRRLVFAFDERADLTLAEFASRFDVLHRTFLSYPVALAPEDRTRKFFTVFKQVVARHGGGGGSLSPDQIAWVAVCSALVQHPETELY